MSRPYDTIDPRILALEVYSFLPTERVVAIDGGNHSAFWVRHLGVKGPRDFVQTSFVGGMSSIGLSMGAAIGAAVGRPESLVSCFMGDASQLMALGDLETAVRYGIPLVIFVSNDQALGAEVHYLELMNMPADIVRVPTPSFAGVAEALGAEGFTVTSERDLELVRKRREQPVRGPIVVDCHVDPTVPADFIDFIFSTAV